MNAQKTQTEEKLPPKGSQARRILDFMKRGNTVTAGMGIDKEIFDPIIMRLPNRIGELRHKYGHTIYQREVKSKTNKRVRWQEYSLKPFEGQG